MDLSIFKIGGWNSLRPNELILFDIRRRKSSQGNALARNTERVHQDRMCGDRQRTTREAQRAREAGREGVQDTRKARNVSLDAATGGAASRAVRNCHGQA